MTNRDSDFMEFGDSNLVPIDDGWFLNIRTKERIDPQGRVFSEQGELIFDPKDYDEGNIALYDRDEYDWYDDDDRR